MSIFDLFPCKKGQKVTLLVPCAAVIILSNTGLALMIFLCYEFNIRNTRRKGYYKMIKGFKMKLYPGMEEEYEVRHNLLWPEMKDMIHEHGGKNYTIFLDKETLTLFGYIEIEDEELWAKGADTAINRKWWDYMADIMETNPDNSPVSVDLKTVFHLD